MSASPTRRLVADLQRRLGAARPLTPAPLPQIPDPPVRVFPRPGRRTAFATRAEPHTTALVGIGHVGTRYATDVVLQFQAELAVAHEAVASELPPAWAEREGLVPVRSRVADQKEHLLRPDLGRRLDPASVERLSQLPKGWDIVPILADGLSAKACLDGGAGLLQAFRGACEARGLRVGPAVGARFARVWLEDEIGEILHTKVAAILLGERPGLGTGDGLSAYLVFDPRVGRTDADRNMMSNIHKRGVPADHAGPRLAALAAGMIGQGRSGVQLDLAALDPEAGTLVSTAYQAAPRRVPLVTREVP